MTLRPTAIAFLLVLAAPGTAPAQDAEEGGRLFLDFCAACHGAAAEGGGPMQAVLSVEVPDLTGLADRNGGTFPRFDVVSKIDGRDPLVSHGGAMPVWGGFFETGEAAFVATEAGQPIVTSRPIADLVAWLEEVQG